MNTPAYANASLYVGDLLPEVNETILFETFKNVGPVASIRVCRDSITRRSLGYAYVNFHAIADASRAIDTMNFKPIRGKACRIAWSQRDPSKRKSGEGNIFIKNLDKSLDSKALYDKFSSYGNIISAKIACDEHGVSKGYGFVHYDNGPSAEEAIKGANGDSLAGKKLYVATFVPRKDRMSQTIPKWTNIFVKNVPKTYNETQFRELFSKFGIITSAVLMKNEKDEPKGFGFVNFGKHEEAEAAVKEMHEKELEPQSRLYVGRAQKKAEREKELRQTFEKIKRERQSKYQGVNLYVKNLDETIDDAKLREAFAHVGTITSAKVMCDEKTGRSKGFGFVCYSSPEEATKAVTEMNGKLLVNKPIFVALAQRLEQRREQLMAQRNTGIRLQQQAQAAGLTGNPLYPSAVFYQQMPQMMAPARGYVGYGRFAYPGQQQNRGYQQSQGGRNQRPGQQRNANRGPKGQSGRPANNYPIKYNANVRNPQQPPAVTPIATEVSLEDRRTSYGEALYPAIENILKTAKHDDSLAGKITGMVLELSEPEIIRLISDPAYLEKKTLEAIEVLNAHTAASTN